MSRARWLCLIAAIVWLGVAGCGSRRRQAVIVQHPEWSYEQYQRLAVLPFKASRPEGAEAARQAENLLIDQLAANGAFQVLTRSDLKDVLTEQDLARLSDVANPDTALPAGMLDVAQAIVVGQLTDFDVNREKSERRRPRYAYDRYGRMIVDRAGRPRVVGEDVIVEYRHVARLGGTVRVIDAASGRVLMSSSVAPIEKEDSRTGQWPDASPEQLAGDIARELATAFYRRIAPQHVQVKLGGDALLVAGGYFEGRYEELKKVPVTQEEILIVARGLPESADRNEFRLAVSPRDRHEYLAEQPFTWSPSVGARGEVLRVPVARLVESGATQFTAKLFAAGNETPILERDFDLVAPKD